MWPRSRPRSRSMPSFVLIYPTVWLQYTNVTDRQDRQERQHRANRFTNGRPKQHFQSSRNVLYMLTVWPWLGPQLTTMQLCYIIPGFVDDIMFAHSRRGKRNANRVCMYSEWLTRGQNRGRNVMNTKALFVCCEVLTYWILKHLHRKNE